MENTTERKTEILTCLLSMGYERGLGIVVRKGDRTFLAAFKGRNARKRAGEFFDIESAKLGVKVS